MVKTQVHNFLLNFVIIKFHYRQNILMLSMKSSFINSIYEFFYIIFFTLNQMTNVQKKS